MKETPVVMPTPSIAPPANTNVTEGHIKIMIDMDTHGNYTIKEWQDPNMDYKLDGLILEIFKND